MRSWLVSVGLAVTVGVAPQPAFAQASGPAAAKKHFVAAKKAYKSGAYQEAIRELKQAIELDPNGKDLFYNLGLVHEKLGEIDEAIAAFKRYNELETDTGELEKSIQTVRRLEGARDELARKKAAEEAPPKAEAPPRVIVVPGPERERSPTSAKPPKGRLDGWVVATGGLSLAAFGVGTYYGLQALSTRKSSEEATNGSTSVYELEDRAARAHDQAVVADVAFAVGAASAGAALLLYFTRDAKPHAREVAVVVTPRSAALRGAF